MGRYGGALAGVRPDDLGAQDDRGRDRAHRPRSRADLGRLLGRREPGRRGQPGRGAHVQPPGGPSGRGARRHRQPPLRVRPRGGQLGVAGDPPRRGRPLPGRRRGVDEPRAVGRAEAAQGPSARPRDDARHRARLAPHQPPHGRDALDRVDGRDRRERRRALQDLTRGPGRLRPRKPPASRRRDGTRRLRRGNRPNRSASREEGVRPLTDR